jgi:hypothetical protein
MYQYTFGEKLAPPLEMRERLQKRVLYERAVETKADYAPIDGMAAEWELSLYALAKEKLESDINPSFGVENEPKISKHIADFECTSMSVSHSHSLLSNSSILVPNSEGVSSSSPCFKTRRRTYGDSVSQLDIHLLQKQSNEPARLFSIGKWVKTVFFKTSDLPSIIESLKAFMSSHSLDYEENNFSFFVHYTPLYKTAGGNALPRYEKCSLCIRVCKHPILNKFGVFCEYKCGSLAQFKKITRYLAQYVK